MPAGEEGEKGEVEGWRDVAEENVRLGGNPGHNFTGSGLAFGSTSTSAF